MNVLGLSAFYHDSAAALVADGAVVAAAQEERFSRVRHDARFPRHAIEYCLNEADLRLADVDRVVFYDKPFLKFERLLETYLATAPSGFRSFRMAMPIWLKEKLFQKTLLREELTQFDPDLDVTAKLAFSEHHQSHAASAFFASPFEEAVVLTMDGVGEWTTTSVGVGRGAALAIEREIHFPHSLGLLYSAFTYYLGFKVNSGEYKVMGLAPYGEPRYAERVLEHLIDVKADGSFRLDLRYFDYCTGLRMTNGRFDALFGAPRRSPESPLESFHMDMAASIQAVTEEVVLRLTRAIAAEYELPNLCLAGGVALNCVANGKVARDGCFERVWVQPAAGDAGGALGAALAAYHGIEAQPRAARADGRDAMAGGYLGPGFDNDEIATRLSACGARFERLTHSEMLEQTATALAEGRAVGWFQGRMEFGPRALGARSILADPRGLETQRTLNLKIKFRESFRPFAPAVLAEDAGQWFDLAGDSPYMLMVAPVAAAHRVQADDQAQALEGLARLSVPRSSVPAVTHVDHSARVQTVHAETNPCFHALLTAFKARTDCPILVNTSFNVRGEPIVCTPEDAFRCFMGTGLEWLACGDLILRKEAQDPSLARDYSQAFELD